MPEEIKIVVKQESQGTALKDAQKDAEKLQQAQTKGGASGSGGSPNRPSPGASAEVQAARERYATEMRIADLRSKGQGKEADALAKSHAIRERALSLEKSLKVSPEEAVHRATREHALHKAAGGGHGGQFATARMLGELGDMASGHSGWVMRAMQIQRMKHMAGEAAQEGGGGVTGFVKGVVSKLGPAGLIATAATIAAGVVVGAASAVIGENDKNTREDDRLREERTINARARARESQYGSAGEARAKEEAAHDQKENLKDQRKTIEHEAHEGITGTLSTWLQPLLGRDFKTEGMTIFGHHFKTEAERNLEANTHDQQTADIEEKKQAEIKLEKFTKEGGMDSIHAQEAMNSGHIREANDLKDKVTWWKKYNEVKAEVGDTDQTRWMAQEAADAEVFGAQKERAGNFAHLVNARTGAAGAMRLAQLASTQMGGGDPNLVGAVRNLHSTVKDQGNAALLFNFSRLTN